MSIDLSEIEEPINETLTEMSTEEPHGLVTYVSPTGDSVTYPLQGKGVRLCDIEAAVRENLS